jgi:hypothetical protein
VTPLHVFCNPLLRPDVAGQAVWLNAADTVVVVRRGERMLPVAMRLDAAAGRWTVTELRWWCTEHDAQFPPCRGDGREC